MRIIINTMKPSRTFLTNYSIFLLACLFCLACTKYKNITYHFTQLSLNNIDNRTGSPVLHFSDSIPAQAFGIRLNLHPVIDSETSGSFSAEKSSVINSNTITSIHITSSDSFDLNLPPGACLNDRFIYYKNVYGSFTNLNCESSFRPSFYQSKDYRQKSVPDYADILLIKPPVKFKSHSFKIQLNFEDGTVFIDSTNLIKLY